VEHWIVRRDCQGHVIGQPRFYAHPDPVMREPGVLTLEEHMAQMLDEGEACVCGTERLEIRRDGRAVGYVEIVEVDPGRRPGRAD
jgi:hypothetical protein